MKYIIELDGEESPIAIEEVLDREFGRNCKCKVFDGFEYKEIRQKVRESVDENSITRAVVNNMRDLYLKGLFDGVDKIIEKL